MLGKKKKTDNRPYYEQYLADGKEIWDKEKERQLGRREAKKQKEYERLIKTMTVEEAHAYQDKRETEEILQHMQMRSKKAIKKAARKRMGMRSRVKSVVAGAILGGAGYLGLSKVVNTEDRLITRELNNAEYRNEVAKEYLHDCIVPENPRWSTEGKAMDWNSPDWYEQWLDIIAKQDYPALSEDWKDTNVVDAILNGGEYSFIYRDYLMKAPNGGLNPLNTRFAMVGTEEERLEMYSYAFEKKWGIDPSTMSVNDDAMQAAQILSSDGAGKMQEFIDDLALYRATTYESSDYSNHFEALEFASFRGEMPYRDTFDTYADYLNAEASELFETSYSITNESAGIEHLVQEISNAGGLDATTTHLWKEYISIGQARAMCAEDNLYFATPSEILPLFNVNSTDPMFQKYAELGGDEAIVARLLMIEHPGCNTFHADGSIHMTDAGTLTGDALTKFNEDLAYYQDLLAKGDNISALDYANLLYELDPTVMQQNVVDIVNSTTEMVPGDDPLTHIGIPAGMLFLLGYFGVSKYNFCKAVNAEIEADIMKAKAMREMERVKKNTQELLGGNKQQEEEVQEENILTK